MSTYEPGTVAVATVRGLPNVRVMRVAHTGWVSSPETKGPFVHLESEVTDVRPLVVLDLNDEERALLRRVVTTDYTFRLGTLQAVKAQTKPAKPPEPQGLGAVVEDAAGNQWVRAARKSGNSWHKPIGTWSRYEHIDAVRVLSEGVTPC